MSEISDLINRLHETSRITDHEASVVTTTWNDNRSLKEENIKQWRTTIIASLREILGFHRTFEIMAIVSELLLYYIAQTINCFL